MMDKRFRRPLAALAIAAASAACSSVHAAGGNDFSGAERLLFMSEHLANVTPPAALRYAFRKAGSFESGFEDQVLIKLQPDAGGACCASQSEFLTGERKVDLPPLDNARGNPVILGFLERDVNDMQRLTRGKSNYFRKRIRMAVFQGATVREVSLPFRGRTVAGREITIEPYRDDPNLERFGKFADKHYVFTLSDAVPGGVYAIRTRINDPAAPDKPLIVEELVADGASAAPAKRVP